MEHYMAWIVVSFFLFVVAWLCKALEWEKILLFSFFILQEAEESQLCEEVNERK